MCLGYFPAVYTFLDCVFFDFFSAYHSLLSISFQWFNFTTKPLCLSPVAGLINCYVSCRSITYWHSYAFVALKNRMMIHKKSLTWIQNHFSWILKIDQIILLMYWTTKCSRLWNDCMWTYELKCLMKENEIDIQIISAQWQ